MAKRRVLTEYQLERLKEHKYSSSGNTLLDPLMQIFWKWLVEQIPTTWAPNSITLFGLACNFITTIFLMFYCPRGYGYVPSWCYILCAIGLFVYQSLDAIDGKQARRTTSSTPLGELFDHGCDAMSMLLIVIGACISTQLGTYPFIFVVVSTIATSLFYFAQWRTYITQQMHFGLFDVTEGQLVIIFLYLYNSIFGSSIWQEIFLGVELKLWFWLGATFFGILFITSFLDGTFLSLEAKERNRQKFSDWEDKTIVAYQIKPLFLLVFLWVFLILSTCSSKQQLLQKDTVLFMYLFGTITTKMSSTLLVCHMTKSEVGYFDTVFIAPIILILWQLSGLADERICLLIAIVYATCDLLYYVVRVCKDICDYLDIYCFKITPLM